MKFKVGIASIQLAKANGLRIIGTAGTEQGMSDIKEQGADFVFNHKEANYLDKIKEQFPEGVDIVIEMLANVNLNNDLQILKMKKGRVIVVGNRGNIEVCFRILIMN